MGATLIHMTDLEARGFARLKAERELRMVQLYGNGLAPIGATAEVTSTRDYDLSRRWALALWEHPEKPDGIGYMSRHDDQELCVDLFDRARAAISVSSPPGRAMTADTWLLGEVLNHYQVGVV